MPFDGEKKFVPFGRYRPDPPDFDSPDLQIAENVAPIFDGYRIVNKNEQIDPATPPAGGLNPLDPVTGAIASLVTDQRDTVLLRPVSDERNDNDEYFNQDDEQEDEEGNRILYKSVNDETANLSTYVKTNSQASPSYAAKIDPPEGTPIPTTAPWIMKARYEVLEVGVWTFNLILIADGAAQANASANGTGPEEGEVQFSIDQGTINGIVDTSTMQLLIGFSLTPSAGGDPTIKIENPFSGVSWRAGGSTIPTSGEDWVEVVDDEDPVTGIKFRTTRGALRGIGYNIAEPIALTASTRVRVRVYHRESDATKQTYIVAGDSAKALPNKATDDWDEVEFTGAEINQSELSSIRIEYNTDRDGAPLESTSFRIYEVEIYAGEVPEGRCHNMQLITTAGTVESNDLVEIYTGKFTSIQRANEAGVLIDVNTGLTQGSAWYFAQFGQNLIATNFQEEILVIAPGDASFSNLITNPSPAPRARYVAQCFSHLILGDINYTGAVAGQANEVWWSAFNDPTDFAPSKATGADRQPLYHTRGRVTGLTGGDACLVFKPTSIIRLDYRGGQLIFGVRVLSYNIGTVYSKSIVQAGHDTYFFSGADFVRIRGYQQIEHIGDHVITKSIIDSLAGDKSFTSGSYQNLSELENSIIGAYDDHSEIVWWIYRAKGDPPETSMYEHFKMISYAIKEDRWSSMDIKDISPASIADAISQVVSYPSFREELPSLHRGIRTISRPSGGLSYVGAFKRNQTYQARLGTKWFTSNTMAGEPGHNIEILAIRPLATPTNIIPNEMKITVFGSEKPGEDQTSQSTFGRDRDTDGWFPFSIQGEFIRAEFEIPELGQEELDIEGADYIYRIAGRR